ncbi:22188_t:CDS:2 [Cetraspora pellucida]|uniref:22188_t:CDS:1 n=1 Tax=Cetraspora pellucida TaxID=1433469 RepID=A0A9N9GLN8_9GLOM|nr:22188_t:CDS:2 [Cetraspora pellucida]
MYAENRETEKTDDDDERETIMTSDSPIPTRSSFMQNTVDYLEYLAEQDEYAPPQAPKHDLGPSDHSDPPTELSSSFGQYPTYPSNPEIIEQYISQSSLPLSPLDEVRSKMVDIQTVPSHQIMIYSHNPQFQNVSIEMTEGMTHSSSSQQRQENLVPSSLTLPSVTMTRNRSRIKNPKIENMPQIRSGFTAQIQTSNTPLRQEFRESDIMSPTHLKQLQSQSRHSNISTSFLRNSVSSNDSILQTEVRVAHGDPDDPLLNNQNRLNNSKITTRSVPFPQQLVPHYHHQSQNNEDEGLTSPISPGAITETPLLNSGKKSFTPKGLIICLCFGVIAGIIFTLWAVTTLVPNNVPKAGNKAVNARQPIPKI